MKALLWSRFPGGPRCFPTMCPYSCLGKGEPRGKWVPWKSFREGSMGRRKEREHGGKWLACCPDAMFLSFCDFRAPGCGSFKSRDWLGAKLQGPGCFCGAGSGWHRPLASNGGPPLVWCTCSLSAPCKAWPWSELRSPPLHCFGS